MILKKMNEFELFTMIYFALDAFYGTKIEVAFEMLQYVLDNYEEE